MSSFVPPSSLINDAAKVNKAVFMPAVYILLYLKRHDDAHAHNISNIDVLYDFHLIYISYENINFWIITVLKKNGPKTIDRHKITDWLNLYTYN